MPPDLEALAEDQPVPSLSAVREEAFWREIKAFYQRAPELTRVTLQALGNGQCDSRCVSFPEPRRPVPARDTARTRPGSARGVCVLLLSPGIKGRVGPHRLYLKIAERLTPLGFHVLRFDYHGLGDSEGELAERVLADMYNSIQAGRYVGDTIAAMDWMQETFGIRRFVGSGLCGGIDQRTPNGGVDSRIECLLGIGLPTVLEGGPENWARVLSQHQIVSMRNSYFSKLVDPKSLMRFLSGKSNYRTILKI